MRELHLKYTLPADVTDTSCGSCRYVHDSWRATGCELFRVTLRKQRRKVLRASGCIAAEKPVPLKDASPQLDAGRCEECEGLCLVEVPFPPPTRGSKVVDCPACNGTGRSPNA